MTKRGCITGLACLALLCGPARSASAAPTIRLQLDQRGDFVLLGNTLAQECASGTPPPVVGTVGDCGTNVEDNAPDVSWRCDDAAGTANASVSVPLATARTSAKLIIPSGAVITNAFLYWGARNPTNVADTAVTLDRQGGFTAPVNALKSWVITQGGNFWYQAMADVTLLVQANGPGSYRVSDVSCSPMINIFDNGLLSSWWMVVFYKLNTDPPRNLALFDGFDWVGQASPQNATLAGFVVPNAGFDAKLGVVVYDGDYSIKGDQLAFNGHTLSDAMNPADNFFNSTRSFLGAPVSVPGDLPQLTGTPGSMGGLDLDVVDIKSYLVAGQTSAPITATTLGDNYILGGFVTSISTYRPNFDTSTKVATDPSGPLVLDGDVIDYTIVVTNTGNDTSVDTVLTDVLPMGVTYVPGSITIEGVSKSDAKDLDEAELVGGTITCRLGSGANGVKGGDIDPGGSTTVTFKVKIDAGTMGKIANQGTISAGGKQGQGTLFFVTDGNGNLPGSPPTIILVGQCQSNGDCSSPTAICDKSQIPHLCVQCDLGSDCPASAPVCDPVAKTCSCPPGMVSCMNDGGATTTTGVGTGGAGTTGAGGKDGGGQGGHGGGNVTSGSSTGGHGGGNGSGNGTGTGTGAGTGGSGGVAGDTLYATGKGLFSCSIQRGERGEGDGEGPAGALAACLALSALLERRRRGQAGSLR